MKRLSLMVKLKAELNVLNPMESQNDILKELNSISEVVAAIPNKNVFTAPDGYFDEVYMQIHKRLHSLGEPNASVPEGYFEQLSTNILNKIKQNNAGNEVYEELASVSALIASIGNHNVFTVPEEYFNDNETLLLQTTKTVAAPVVQMHQRPKLFRYMAAAAVAGIIGLSLFGLFKPNEQKTDTQLAATVTLANEIIAEDNFEEEFAKISGEDIEQYLEERGQNVNAALAASRLEDKDLPEPLDYIIDENALTDFLQQRNFSN